jgi:hypothetical protein
MISKGAAIDSSVKWTPWVPVSLGLYACLVGLTSFIGWAADVRRLTDWYNSGISIQPNTTIAAMAAGAAVVLLALNRTRAATALGLIAGLLGATSIFHGRRVRSPSHEADQTASLARSSGVVGSECRIPPLAITSASTHCSTN